MSATNTTPNDPGKALEQIENAAFQRDRAWVSHLLDQVHAQRFHGRITLICEKGFVVRAVKEQSLLPPHRSPE